jgi:hypothetical protein
MTQAEEVELALGKAMTMFDKIEEMIARLPPEKRNDPSIQRMRSSAHATVVNLGQALRIAQGGGGASLSS